MGARRRASLGFAATDGEFGMDWSKAVSSRLPTIVALTVAAVGGGVTSPGCATFDTTPPAVTHGSLGEEIYQVFCERLAADADRTDVNGVRWKPLCEGQAEPPPGAPARLVALHANRARLVEALDRTMPEETTDELGRFLGALLPFFDPPEERLPTQTRRLADFLNRLAADDDAVDALERLGTRQGYRPLRLALGVTRPVMAYPELDSFVSLALDTLLDGPAADELTALQSALALEMATMEAEPFEPSEETTLQILRELMFTEDDLFSVGSPSWVLVRDRRGLALPANGAIAAPFVDQDSDGLADVDGFGRFVDVSGEPLSIPTPFRIVDEGAVPRDTAGRALRGDATRYFQYLDASRTMLAGTTAELAPWFRPESPTLLQMSRGLPLLFGGPREATFDYGAHALRYSSFETDQGSIFDVVQAVGEMMHRPRTDDALAVAEALLREHESATAGVLRAARFTANQGDLYPSARLTAPSNFWDDLIDLVIRIAERPGMLEAVMRSFSDPRSAQLGTIYGGLMRNRDRVTYDARPGAQNLPPVGMPLDEPVNPALPDTFDNESLFQRTLALIDGLNGVRVCNKEGAVLRISLGVFSFRYPLVGSARECELIDIRNVAEAYALAILGRYELELQSGFLNFLVDVADTVGIDIDEALERSSGIDGLTRRPTPQALNRLVFWGLSDDSGVRSCSGVDCNSEFAGQVFDPVRDRHGNLVIERYHGTIFAWEMPGFYEGMTPLLEVLHQPGYRTDSSGRYMFGELLGTLHAHWASPANPMTCGERDTSVMRCARGAANFSHHSNVRSYEALVADAFIDGELLERVHGLNLALEQIEVRPGEDGVTVLAAAAEDLVDPRRSTGLTDRQGRTEVSVNDGTRSAPVTPLYLVLEALNAMDRDLEVDRDRLREWRDARHAIAEQFLATETLGEQFRFGNARARAILVTALPFARERIAAHRDAGDLVAWATTLHARFAETMEEPLFAALVRFLDAVNEDPAAREALAALMGYLVDQASDNDAFAATLHGAADALMVLEDDANLVPLLRALSEALAPNVREVVAAGGALDTEGSALRDTLALLRDVQDVDDERMLRTLLQNAVQLPAEGDEVTPLETIIDVITEVNRATPSEGTSLRADDYRAVIGNVTDYMTDERRGLERLTRVVQQRECFPEQGLACNEEGARIASQGLCYADGYCACGRDGDGPLEWRCAAP